MKKYMTPTYEVEYFKVKSTVCTYATSENPDTGFGDQGAVEDPGTF